MNSQISKTSRCAKPFTWKWVLFAWNRICRGTHFHMNAGFRIEARFDTEAKEMAWFKSQVFLLIIVFVPMLAAGSGHHGRKVFTLNFHPFDDNIFLTGGWDRYIKVQTKSCSIGKTRPYRRISDMEILQSLLLSLDGYFWSLCLHFKLACGPS